jgi:hypothetical protein
MFEIGVTTNRKPPADPYLWKDTVVDGILSRMEYLGHMVNFKFYKKSYKSKRSYHNPQENWMVFRGRAPCDCGKNRVGQGSGTAEAQAVYD